MDLSISAADGADDRDVVSLYRWFAQDASVSRHARVTLEEQAPRPGAMGGGTFALINALLADAGAVAGLGSLLIAFKSWRGTRSRPPAITIRYGDVTVTVTDGSEDEIRPLLDALVPPPSSAPSPSPSPSPSGEEEPGER